MSNKVDELGERILEWTEEIEGLTWRDAEKWQKGDYREDAKKMAEWIKKRSEFFEKEYGEDMPSDVIIEENNG